MFKRILVPLDGSELAEKALPFTLLLAKELTATLVLFHVVEKSAPTEIHGQYHIRDVEEARQYLDKVSHRFAQERMQFEQDIHEVQEMGVAQTICSHAKELNADMVVLTAHGNGGLRDIFLGSIAQQVIRQGETPVLFIRPEMVFSDKTQKVQKILVPLDGSKEHEGSLSVAAFLAEKMDSKVELITVIPSLDTLPVKEILTSRVSPRLTKVALRNYANQAENYLKTCIEALVKKDIKTSASVLQGNVPVKIAEIIQSKEIDLVVMATHGHSSIDANWIGSLTPQFLQLTKVPVMLVNGSGCD